VKSRGEELPVLSWHPKGRPWNGKVVIWADGGGKAAVAARPELKKLLDAGFAVIAADLLYQGEFLADGKPLGEQPKVANNRAYAGFTYGYNAPLFAKRVHDLLTLIAFVANDEHAPKDVTLIGSGGAGPIAAAARTRAGGKVTRTVADTGGFRFAKLASYRHPDFLPGAVKYGDLPALFDASSDRELWVAGEPAPEGARAVAGIAEAVEVLIK
jgi:hypothetical protein